MANLKIPQGWSVSKLKDLGDIVTGSTPPKKNPEFYGNEIPLYKPTDLDAGYEVIEARSFLSKQGAKNARILPELSVLVTCIGATIGKTGLARKECATNQQINAVVPHSSSINSNWLYWVLCSPASQKQIVESASATTLPIINKTRFQELDVPLPPLNEQRRIVEKIEALSAHSRKARQALDSIPALLDQFRQSVLAAAFRGDLTADWRAQHPEVEPASALLEAFVESRAEAYEAQRRTMLADNKRVPKLPSVEISPESYSFPADWLNFSIESASLFIIDCLHSTPKFFEEGEYCIDTTCIEPFKINWSKARKVTPEDFLIRTSRLLPEPGDILFSREGTIGTTVKVNEGEKLCLGQRMMMFRFGPLVVPEYAEMYLQSPTFKTQYEPLITGTTSPHVNIGELRKLSFLLPSVDEQLEIVKQVQKYLDGCEKISSLYKNSQLEVDQLDQSILAKAFRGQLVPQDPTDEPASLLLERIRTKRQAAAAAAKAAKRKTRKPTT